MDFLTLLIYEGKKSQYRIEYLKNSQKDNKSFIDQKTSTNSLFED
jgi:hypothetical protein